MNRALQARRVHFVQTLFCRVLESRNILSNEGSFKRFLSDVVPWRDPDQGEDQDGQGERSSQIGVLRTFPFDVITLSSLRVLFAHQPLIILTCSTVAFHASVPA